MRLNDFNYFGYDVMLATNNFSFFHKLFSKAFSFRVIKDQDCVVKVPFATAQLFLWSMKMKIRTQRMWSLTYDHNHLLKHDILFTNTLQMAKL